MNTTPSNKQHYVEKKINDANSSCLITLVHVDTVDCSSLGTQLTEKSNLVLNN